MKNQRLIIVTIVSILLCGSIAYAADSQPIQAFLTDIKLYLNGDRVDKEVIVIDGTSYLPVRAISEALELEVKWVGDTRTIYLSESKQVATEETTSTVNVSGRWTTSKGSILILNQNGKFITGSVILYTDETQWPIPVEGMIQGNKLTLDVKHDNQSIVQWYYGLPDDDLFLSSVIYKGVSDQFTLDVSSDTLSGTFQYAKIWWKSGIFPSLEKIANGGSAENTNELTDATFNKDN